MPLYTPWTTRRVGIELEFNNTTVLGSTLNAAAVSRAVAAAFDRDGFTGENIVTRDYGHNDGTIWESKTDSSCGLEFTMPALSLDANGHNAKIKSACDAIEALNPNINRSCGYHVHVELPDYSWQDMQKLLALWIRYEPFFFEMLPSSRRDNNYCYPLRGVTWDAQLSAGFRTAMTATTSRTFETAVRTGMRTRGSEKYRSLNLTSWWLHKRVEFRLGAGTVNYTRVRRWAMFLLALVERVKSTRFPALQRLGRSTTFAARIPNTDYIAGVLGIGPRAASGMLAGTRAVDVTSPETRELYTWLRTERTRFTPSAVHYGSVPARAARAAAAQTPDVPARMEVARLRRIAGIEAGSRRMPANQTAAGIQPIAALEALLRGGLTAESIAATANLDAAIAARNQRRDAQRHADAQRLIAADAVAIEAAAAELAALRSTLGTILQDNRALPESTLRQIATLLNVPVPA